MDDETLERLAREEILKEAKRGAARADAIGPTGWQKCPVPPTNKRFLQNTLLNVIGANKLKGSSMKRKSSEDKHSRNVLSSSKKRRNEEKSVKEMKHEQ